MNFLPYENLTYKTRLSKEEILKRLNEVTEPKKMIRWTGIFANKNHLAYEGTIEESGFLINRIIDNRNSFLPQITGSIQKESDQSSTITLKMRLHIFVLVFMGIWLSVVGLVSIAVLSSLFFIDGNNEFNFAVFIPFFMFLFGLLMPTFAFRYEANKSKRFFENLFEVEKQLNDKKI